MNPKEKDELREGLKFMINRVADGVNILSKSQLEYLLKAIEAFEHPDTQSRKPNPHQDNIIIKDGAAFEHPQPLDAGELDGPKEEIKEVIYEWVTDPARYINNQTDCNRHIDYLLQKYIQASITAKQKEIAEYDFWIKELLKALDSGDNRPVEAAVRELQQLMEKHTNE